MRKHRIARYLDRQMSRGSANGGQVERDLRFLNPYENIDKIRKQYEGNRRGLCIKILLAGCLLAFCVAVRERAGSILEEGTRLHRGGPGEGVREICLEAKTGEETYVFEIGLSAREPGEAETEAIIEGMIADLPQLILGKNESLDCVNGDLVLLEKYDGYPALVYWESDDSESLEASGLVHPGLEEKEVMLRATVVLENDKRDAEWSVCIAPRELTEEEKRYHAFQAYLTESEEGSRREGEWQLPAEWEGEAVSWQLKTKQPGLLVLLTTCVVVVAVYKLSDRDLHARTIERRKQLQREYPMFLYELGLFLGAGIGIRSAMEKITADYRQKKEEGGRESLVREEVLLMCRDMQSGVSEVDAYERFGRRIGLQQYVRLSGFLIQSIRRGNRALPELLKEEAYHAMLEKVQQGRKIGEEAGVKLLFPTVMLLALVMFYIMAPAFIGL